MIKLKNLKDLAELNLENPRVTELINTIVQKRGKPEENFKQWFFTDVLEELGYLLGSERHLLDGDIDYAYKTGVHWVGFEVKPPFLGKKENFYTHKDQLHRYVDQVEKYLGDPELHYLTLTDGFNWYFYSKKSLKTASKYFLSLKTLQLLHINSTYQLKDLSSDKILDTLRRWEDESYKEGLDDKFFKALKIWMEQIYNDLKDQLPVTDINREAVNLINKLIFIRTLEDLGSLPYNYLRKEMAQFFHKWKKVEGSKKLLQETNEWIYKHYDTELFSQTNIFISPDVWEFLLLGNISPTTGLLFNPCLYDFNFANIDFDVLGHVYEQYLAELKKERGIYYTRRFVVEYIVNNTIGRKATEITNRAIEHLKQDNLEASKGTIQEILDLKILDPAPGSGSFLICAFDVLARHYLQWEKSYIEAYNKANRKNSLPLFQRHGGTSVIQNWKENIMLNCLYGCDIDPNAVAVAKLNLWLRLIRTNPEEYYWKDLQEKNVIHALPNLSLNLICGNSLLGMGIDETFNELTVVYEKELKYILEHEKQYRENFRMDADLVDKIQKGKQEVRKGLQEKLGKYLIEKEVDPKVLETATFWALEFPFLNFDFVIGNPPYIGEEDHKEIFRPVKATPLLGEYHEGKMDYWYFFCHLGISLLKEGGEISFIVPHYWPTAEGAKKLIKRITEETEIKEIFDFQEYTVFKESAPGQHNMVFRLKRSKSLGRPSVSKITRLDLTEGEMKQALTGDDVPGVQRFLAQQQDKLLDSSGKLHFTPREIENVCDVIMKNADYKLGGKEGLFNINQGVVPAIDIVSKKTLRRILIKKGEREPTEDEIQQLEKKLGIKRKDGVFVVSKSMFQKWKLNKFERELIKPFHWAEQIGKFYAQRNHEHFIIYTSLQRGRVIQSNAKNYPTIKRHLDKFQVVITSDNKPYGLHRARDEKIFLKEKIVGIRQTNFPSFAYVDFPYYMGMACNIITEKESPSRKVSLKAVTAILNSSLAYFWFYHKGKRKGELLQIDGKPLEEFPLKFPDAKNANLLETLVDGIISSKDIYYKLLKQWRKASETLFGKGTVSVREYINLHGKPILTESINITEQTELLDLDIALRKTRLIFCTNQGEITYNFKNHYLALHLLYFLHYQKAVEKKKIKNIDKLLNLELPFQRDTIFKKISVMDLFKELKEEFEQATLNLSPIQEKISRNEERINQIVKRFYKVEEHDLHIKNR